MTIKDLVIGGAAGATLAVLGTLYVSGGALATPPAGAEAATATAGAVQATPVQPPVPAASAAASASQAGARPAAAAPAVACPPTVAVADARKAASAAAAGPARVDVPAVTLSAEHAKLLVSRDDQPLTLPELHGRFAGEPLDPAWSQQMEAQLRQALQDAGVQKGFELLAVECRRTLCELRLFGTGPDAGQRWGSITSQLSQQSWWGANFSGASSSTTGMNDRSVIATVLHRSKR